ncbi:MAG: HAMP domain-containing protein [Proteobacteria bacterium]|nr:HAMP domain-containing protein [Pseudomonadota bacterium]MBU2226133.1 HAMP domain-containing protein [Pseudomonadota bacterium]MBU2262250.1 HAMP domain-containing protein [Pseudomonadota bacterium]
MSKRLESFKRRLGLLKPYYRSLGFKLFAFISGVLILFAAVTAYYAVRVQEQQLIDEVLTGADNIAQAIEYATRTSMLENRKEKIQEIIAYIAAKTEGIEAIKLIDKKGVVRESTAPDERGRVIAKTAGQCALCHAGDKPREALARDLRTRITAAKDGSRKVISMIHAIYNEEGCSVRCHTVHPIAQKVLGVFDITLSLDSVNKKIASNRRHMMVFYLIITALAAIILFILMRPINALIEGLKAVSRGEFDVKIPVFTGDELGKLSSSFNKMIEKFRGEIEYGNLLMYDAELIGREDEPVENGGKRQAGQKKQNGSGSSFPEIYDRISDETHLKIVRSVKLASLGKLSAGIAHEINNPLTAVLSYSSLLLDRIDSPKEKAWLETIVEETKRCRNIITALLEFSRQTAPEKVPTHINEVVERAVGLLGNQESFHNISIVKSLDPSLPRVKIDRGQIYQVFMNLMINAADAMNSRGVLTIESRRNVVKSTVAEDRHFVEVSFSDTGYGIPQENIERLFDPFFTTKDPSVGTGLGLSICHGIIKRHNGNIKVQSKLGEGSTFTISLPAHGET